MKKPAPNDIINLIQDIPVENNFNGGDNAETIHGYLMGSFRVTQNIF